MHTRLQPPFGEPYVTTDIPLPVGKRAAWTDWIPAYSVLPAELQDVPVYGADSSSLYEDSWVLPTLTSGMDYFAIPVSDFISAAPYGDVHVFDGAVSTAALHAALADTRYEETGTDTGMTVYTRDDQPRAVAEANGTILFTRDPNPVEVVTLLADTKLGDSPRRYDEDVEFQRWSVWPLALNHR